MKKALFLALLLIMLAAAALAADATDSTSFLGATVGENAAHVSFPGAVTVDVAELRQFIAFHPKLVQIDLFDAKIDKNDMMALADAYPKIFFGFTFNISEHTLRTDQTAFSTLHSKRSPGHKSEDFAVLKLMKKLEALDIGHNYVKDISFLYDLPNLKILIIALNEITDITPVGSLKDLEYLEMFTNKVTDISPLAHLRKLLDLNIGFNKIQDISPLLSLTSLERLWMYSYKQVKVEATPEVKQQLREALPDTRFNFHNYPTLAGWREHQRYYVLYQVFKTSTFLPWDAPVPVVKGP